MSIFKKKISKLKRKTQNLEKKLKKLKQKTLKFSANPLSKLQVVENVSFSRHLVHMKIFVQSFIFPFVLSRQATLFSGPLVFIRMPFMKNRKMFIYLYVRPATQNALKLMVVFF